MVNTLCLWLGVCVSENGDMMITQWIKAALFSAELQIGDISNRIWAPTNATFMKDLTQRGVSQTAGTPDTKTGGLEVHIYIYIYK